MSEMEQFVGTLREIELKEGETLEQRCKQIADVEELPKWCDSWYEYVNLEMEDTYLVRNNKLYTVDRQEMEDDRDIFELEKQKDGSYKFVVRYYNGGCSFDEAIEYAFEGTGE